jgi:catechol 2,3-dioxygenase-like lactoylglutathione lyase family enzyme
MNRLGLVTYVAREYDEAIGFFVGKLGFTLAEDTDMGDGKRWVVVSPSEGASLLIARAEGEQQKASIGNQTGGRVGFFLQTDNFERDFEAWTSRGVVFREQPRQEAYGTVAVFEDVYGNTWDLIQPA